MSSQNPTAEKAKKKEVEDPYTEDDDYLATGNPSKRTRPGTAPGEQTYEKVKDRSGRLVSNKPANAGQLAWQTWKQQDDAKKQRIASGKPLPGDVGDPWTLGSVLMTLGTLLCIGMLLGNFVTESPFWGFEKPAIKYVRGVFWPGNKVFTPSELSVFDGYDFKKPLYLSIDGDVYDVSSSRRLYGPHGSYHFMAGKDASRAFVTGCFDTHQTHDLRGLSESELKSLENWKTFFRKHERYTKVGTVALPEIDPDSPIPEPCHVTPEDPTVGKGKTATGADAPGPVQAQAPVEGGAAHHHGHGHGEKEQGHGQAKPKPAAAPKEEL